MAEKRGRGRPAFVPTALQRRTVEEMISCGETKRSVYLALGIDEATLNKHFELELETGGAKKRKELLGLLWKQARKGNSACIKKLEEMQRIAGAAAAMGERGKKEPEPGKKEQQQAAAERVGTAGKFAPPAPPKLVVNNP
jgi:hypothetical protein